MGWIKTGLAHLHQSRCSLGDITFALHVYCHPDGHQQCHLSSKPEPRAQGRSLSGSAGGMLGQICPGFGTARRGEACASSKLAKRSCSATPRVWTCLHLQPVRGLLMFFFSPSEALHLPEALPCGQRLRDPAQQLADGVGGHKHNSSCSRAFLARPSSSGRWARVLKDGVDCDSLAGLAQERPTSFNCLLCLSGPVCWPRAS